MRTPSRISQAGKAPGTRRPRHRRLALATLAAFAALCAFAAAAAQSARVEQLEMHEIKCLFAASTAGVVPDAVQVCTAAFQAASDPALAGPVVAAREMRDVKRLFRSYRSVPDLSVQEPTLAEQMRQLKRLARALEHAHPPAGTYLTSK